MKKYILLTIITLIVFSCETKTVEVDKVAGQQLWGDNIGNGFTLGSNDDMQTTLDVIQSNSLLLAAQISLANSQRNYLMAQYDLLKSVGLLNSNYLKLK